MKFSTTFSILTAFAFSVAVDARSVPVRRAESSDITQFLKTQVPFGKERIIAHINQTTGALVAGAAAPLPRDEYQYYWVRDGGLSMAALADLYAATGKTDAEIASNFDLFFKWTQLTQKNARTSTPGWFTEKQAWTKYDLDGVPYAQWMSPQYDGPALRAIAFMKFAAATNSFAKYYSPNDPNSVLKTDLDSVVRSWSLADGYEPWEEVIGQHFFQNVAQYRALTDGAAVVEKLGGAADATIYRNTAASILNSLGKYWDGNHIHATLNGARNGGDNEGAGAKVNAGHFLDISSILAVIHGSDDKVFPATNEQVQATFYQIVQAFTQGLYKPPRSLSDWSLNQKETTFNGLPMNPAVGRYPEDIYDGYPFGYTYKDSKGAGFWFLATNALAETLYKAVDQYSRTGSIVINDVNAGFWSFIGVNTKQTIPKSSPLFAQTLGLLLDHGDRFIRRTSKYVTKEGYASEQFQFATGAQQGTNDLAWSYASFISASIARDQAIKVAGGVPIVVPTATPTPTAPATSTRATSTAAATGLPALVCPVDDAKKTDCGFAGINQSGCEAKGCCWKAAAPNSATPWCFNKVAGTFPSATVAPTVAPTSTVKSIPSATPTNVDTCVVADSAKIDCGYAGIDQNGCAAKGCCWKAAAPNSGTPWCFYKSAQLPPASGCLVAAH
ncbi:Six-hairpin glycosidase-like protein [Fimicolochytrium jonesii]|uniref:Six-hairpin glycosidase-like protein n=1 Tax=Fimicolochytrium jonesii TaxID=1396493 RepID=UPI0022FDB903|nr:Six-hairpin glycosidase-like protein [Fimicolochytrium jonesii]KAI8826754.1 Six-hairpin glycosidase-like protein [Fimicolochytrium jonesii]